MVARSNIGRGRTLLYRPRGNFRELWGALLGDENGDPVMVP